MASTALNDSMIWYSACNEDGASEREALQPQGRDVVCITASGSRSFELLLRDPRSIVSIDQNPTQTALAELFAAAYRTLSYPDFAAFVGLDPDDARAPRARALAQGLSPASRDFWRRHAALAQPGLLYCGRWERFLRQFRRWAGGRRRALAHGLLAAPDIAAQRRFWVERWDDWRWRAFLRVLALRPLWRWGLREPGVVFVPEDFDMAAYARARFDHAAAHLHLAHTPFAWLLLAGGYPAHVTPPFLTQQGHALIRDRIERVTFRTASLRETLEGGPPGAFDAASLSDYSSYCDVDDQRLIWRALARSLRVGGRVCERKFFNKTGDDLPQAFGFTREPALEARLAQSDGAWFYTFVVAQKGETT